MKEVDLHKFATQLHFKKLTADDIRNNPCFSLIEDGNFVAFVVIPASADKKCQIEGICGEMDVARGVG